jgi:hypothetical protein
MGQADVAGVGPVPQNQAVHLAQMADGQEAVDGHRDVPAGETGLTAGEET